MADVKVFPTIVPLEPNAELVRLLEDLLHAAQQGKIRGMAYAVVQHTGDLVTGWNTLPSRANVFTLLGGLDYLRFRVMQEQLIEAPESPLPWLRS